MSLMTRTSLIWSCETNSHFWFLITINAPRRFQMKWFIQSKMAAALTFISYFFIFFYWFCSFLTGERLLTNWLQENKERSISNLWTSKFCWYLFRKSHQFQSNGLFRFGVLSRLLGWRWKHPPPPPPRMNSVKKWGFLVGAKYYITPIIHLHSIEIVVLSKTLRSE